MYRHDFFQTGVPYLIIALILISVIAYAEYFLEQQNSQVHTIKITPLEEEGYEFTNDLGGSELEVDSLLASLLESITASETKAGDVLNDPRITHLDKRARESIISTLAKMSFQKKDYEQTKHLLDSLTVEQRIRTSNQFIFALVLSRIGEQEKAIAQYVLFSEVKPHNFSALLNRGLLLKRTEEYERAIVVLSRAVSASSGYKKAKALAILATCEYKLGRYDEAIRFYKKSTQYQPNNNRTWSKLGKAYNASLLPYQYARDAYNKALALNMRDSRIYFSRAYSQLMNIDYRLLTDQLANTALLSNDIRTHHLLAWGYLEQGMRSKAKKHIKFLMNYEASKLKVAQAKMLFLYANKKYIKLISLAKKSKNKSAEANYLMALTYRKLGLYKRSLVIFEKLLSNNMFRWRSEFQIARIKRSRKQYHEAVLEYQRLIAHNDQSAATSFELALSYEGLVQGEKGLEAINKAIDINSLSKPYQLAKARHLVLLQQYDEAMSVLNVLLGGSPHYVRGLLGKAALQSIMSLPEQAIDSYQLVLTVQSSHTKALERLASLLMASGRYREAQAYLITRLNMHSEDVDIRYWLAYAYYKNKQEVRAVAEIDNILKLDKGHRLAHELKQIINAGNS